MHMASLSGRMLLVAAACRAACEDSMALAPGSEVKYLLSSCLMPLSYLFLHSTFAYDF